MLQTIKELRIYSKPSFDKKLNVVWFDGILEDNTKVTTLIKTYDSFITKEELNSTIELLGNAKEICKEKQFNVPNPMMKIEGERK